MNERALWGFRSPIWNPVDSDNNQSFKIVKQKFILLGSIAFLIGATSFPNANSIMQPTLAFADTDALDPDLVQDFAAKDTSRIVGSIVKGVTQMSPYVDILDGGSMPAGVSRVQRVIAGERAVLNASLVRPTFVKSNEIAGTVGNSAEVGSSEFTYEPYTFRGMGPLIDVKTTWESFKGSYSAAETTLRQQLVQLHNADVRANLLDRGGCKMVVKTGKTFSEMFDGDINKIDTPFANIGLPNASLNFSLLEYLGRELRENLGVEPFETQEEPVLRLMCSLELTSILRKEADIKTNHQYMAAGSYNAGKMALTRYRWEGPYRGYSFGIDPKPLRFNVLNGSGQPVLIEPEVEYATTNGVGSRPNPAWIRAKYEIAFVVGAGSFKKLTPEVPTGEGSFSFPAQGTSGQLMWQIIKDNDNNAWGDYGRHFYQFERAYRPEKPHAVTAISYARVQTDFSLSEVTDFGHYSSTASL